VLDHTYIHNMWRVICQRMNEVAISEADASFLQQLYAAYSECINELGDNCMAPDQLDYFTRALEAQLKEYYQRLTARQGKSLR
jgi:ABC-type tungstate transport system substrate-binding protein